MIYYVNGKATYFPREPLSDGDAEEMELKRRQLARGFGGPQNIIENIHISSTDETQSDLFRKDAQAKERERGR